MLLLDIKLEFDATRLSSSDSQLKLPRYQSKMKLQPPTEWIGAKDSDSYILSKQPETTRLASRCGKSEQKKYVHASPEMEAFDMTTKHE